MFFGRMRPFQTLTSTHLHPKNNPSQCLFHLPSDGLYSSIFKDFGLVLSQGCMRFPMLTYWTWHNLTRSFQCKSANPFLLHFTDLEQEKHPLLYDMTLAQGPKDQFPVCDWENYLELETFELETHFLVFEFLGQPSIVDQPLQHNFDRNPIVLDPLFPSFQIKTSHMYFSPTGSKAPTAPPSWPSAAAAKRRGSNSSRWCCRWSWPFRAQLRAVHSMFSIGFDKNERGGKYGKMIRNPWKSLELAFFITDDLPHDKFHTWCMMCDVYSFGVCIKT